MSAPGGPSILVVEDEPATRYVVSSVLEAEGYVVRTAADGAEALQAATAEPPSLLLLDWMLPDQDGEQVAQAIRAHAPEVQILVVTADGRAQDKARRVQALGYLSKPFMLDQLVALVARHMSAL